MMGESQCFIRLMMGWKMKLRCVAVFGASAEAVMFISGRMVLVLSTFECLLSFVRVMQLVKRECE